MPKYVEKQDWRGILAQDKLVQLLDIKLLEAAEGFAKTQVTLTEKHMNGVGFTHGGTIFTLADYALAAASSSFGVIGVFINGNLSIIKSSHLGETLTATAKKEHQGWRLGFFEVTVTDEAGNLVAKMDAITSRPGPPKED